MLKQKLIRFMYGRYGASAGIDGLGWCLFIMSFAFSFLGRFSRNKVVYAVFSVLSLACTVYLIFRFLSKKIYSRQKENVWFMGIFRKVRDFFKLQSDRFKDRKTHVYKRCPKCKAVLRLPKKKGKHSVVCPRCSKRFDVRNLF